MKANQKFRDSEDAVSPVIAVILMVAITVVLAATVYVWVSGFGSQSSNPAKTMSITSSGALSNTWKNYTVAAASSGMKYSDITVTVNGVTYALDTAGDCSTSPYTVAVGKYVSCSATTLQTAASVVNAGHTLALRGISSGQTLRILDSQANSVILTLVIG